MPLPKELETVVQDEVTRLADVVQSLTDQRKQGSSRHAHESARASELTSNLVAARRVEDKAMLASDEAVSHALRDKFRGDVKTLDRLIEKPYFARLVVREEVGSSEREFEYRIGTAANTECRIIDWRKAPISKLYYEYKEGDEYSEEIQGRERNGTVVVRNMLEIEHRKLRKVVCKQGTAVLQGSEWTATGSGSASSRSYSALPSVLALITAEQFRTITEEAESAVLIQGVAGSGKTTVALHRLAWLLHEDNSPLVSKECVVIAINPILKLYIQRSLQQLGIEDVAVRTFEELAARAVEKLIPRCVEKGARAEDLPRIVRPSTPCPLLLDQAKRSLAVFQALEEHASGTGDKSTSAEQVYVAALTNSKRIIELDETKFLTRDILAALLERTKANLVAGALDYADDALLVRLHQLLAGTTARHDGSEGAYQQVVVDEVQELSPAELASIIGSVDDLQHLTLVGDVAQRMSTNSGFPGWEKLRVHWDTSGSLSHYVTLSVSHRSTAAIMNLAASVLQSAPIKSTRPGRPPRWFYSRHESQALKALISWLAKSVELYPSSLTAIICRDQVEARLAYSYLTPTFGASIRLWENHSATFEEGIVVTNVTQAKGLEFTNALIWNPTIKSYPNTPENRNALYVAITRAEENLCIVTWQKPSLLLPSPQASVVRGFELDTDEEENAGPAPRAAKG